MYTTWDQHIVDMLYDIIFLELSIFFSMLCDYKIKKKKLDIVYISLSKI